MATAVSVDPTILVIFGAGGDLTWRKLVPALYNLHLDGWLPEKFAAIGVDHKEMSEDDLRQRLRQGVDTFSRRGKTENQSWEHFASHIHYLAAGFDDEQVFHRLAQRIAEQEKQWSSKAVRIFYQATPPLLLEGIVRQLAKVHLARDRERERVVLEKPFGRDLASARALNQMLTSVFHESQIYRIDHYLGKETVQNILAFRFGNALFEPTWDRRYIDHVQITVAEQAGVEHRGQYYEGAGALRDMVQNHLLQILCLTAMEPPVSFDADEIRNKKVDVLRAIRPIPVPQAHHFAVRGQYGPGWIEGQRVVGYREEPGCAPDSPAATFAAVKLFIDNWRWQDVPFYLRTGKRLPVRASQVSIHFRPVPHQSFPSTATSNWDANRLLILIQPSEGILLHFQAKLPGPSVRLESVDMRFCYQEAFPTVSPEAYETLLWDVMRGDTTLFMRVDQVEAAWSVVTPILEAWEDTPPQGFPNYPAGTWGPPTGEILIAQDGRNWLQPALAQGQGVCLVGAERPAGSDRT